MQPAAVVFDNLSEFARECIGIADDAMSKVAALEEELRISKSKETLILTKVAEDQQDRSIPLPRVARTVDRLIKTAFVKRANRAATIEGLQHASKEELFDILEKLASIAVCPVSIMQMEEDGEPVEKSAGQAAVSEDEDAWTKAWREAKAEVRD